MGRHFVWTVLEIICSLVETLLLGRMSTDWIIASTAYSMKHYLPQSIQSIATDGLQSNPLKVLYKTTYVAT
jgi:hypothetical protein